MKSLVIVFSAMLFSMNYCLTYAEERIGILAIAIGTVSIVRNEAPISAEQGASVFQNDTIITGGKSRAQILLLDQTAINISQKANLKIDHFVVGGSEEGLNVKVGAGTFRFISGKIASRNPKKVNVETPIATIGVRGTEFIGGIATESIVALLDGKINVSSDYSNQLIEINGFGVIIDSLGNISTPVRIPDDTLNGLLDAVSTREEILNQEQDDEEEPLNSEERKSEEDEEPLNSEQSESEEDEEPLNSEESESEGNDEQSLNSEESESKGNDEQLSNSEESESEGNDEQPLNSKESELKGSKKPVTKRETKRSGTLSSNKDSLVALEFANNEAKENNFRNIVALANGLRFTNPLRATITENTVFAEDFGTNIPSRYHLLHTGLTDSHLFSIDPISGALTFIDRPDFERPKDRDLNNIYEVDVFAGAASGAAISDRFRVQITDLPMLPLSDFSNEQTQFTLTSDLTNADAVISALKAEKDAQMTLVTDWESFTGAGGIDGWYTYSPPTDLSFRATGLNVRGLTQDIFLRGIEVVYNARTQLIDVTAIGDMVASVDGARAGNFAVNYGLGFTNRSVSEAIRAGFTPGNWRFSTLPGFGGLEPDADDFISITDSQGRDRKNDIAMIVDFGQYFDVNKKRVNYAGIYQSGTDSAGNRLPLTHLHITTGLPTLEENEDIGGGTHPNSFGVQLGDGHLLTGAGGFTILNDASAQTDSLGQPFTPDAEISVVENLTSVGRITTNRDTTTYELQGWMDSHLFKIDSSGNLSFKNAANFDAPQDTNGDNIYAVGVIAKDSRTNVHNPKQVLVNVTNVVESTLPSTQFKGDVAEFTLTNFDVSSQANLLAAIKAQKDTDMSSEGNWSAFTASGNDLFGAYTTTTPHKLSFRAEGGQVGGVTQDVFLRGLEVVYDASTQLIDLSIQGNMVVSINGEKAGTVVDFGLGFTDRSVTEATAAGLTPGHWRFSTLSNFGGGLLPDADDFISITHGGTDRSNDIAMIIDIGQYKKADGLRVNYAGISQAGSDASGNRLTPTTLSLTTGAPTSVASEIAQSATHPNTLNVRLGSGYFLTNAGGFTLLDNPIIRFGPNGQRIDAIASVSVPSNVAGAVGQLTTNRDQNRYEIQGWQDNGKFSGIDGNGHLNFRGGDASDPSDNDGDNTYVVGVLTIDERTNTPQARHILVNVEDEVNVSIPKKITVRENNSGVATLPAKNVKTGGNITFELAAPNSASNSNELFILDAETGELKFKFDPDFETPADIDTDNVYKVALTATDGVAGILNEILSVTVTDELEATDFSSETGVVPNSTAIALQALSSWEKFYALAHSGIYTFNSTGGSGYPTDFKLIYNANTKKVDVNAKGNVQAIVGGVSDEVFFDLKYTGYDVSSFATNGFAAGQFTLTTNTNAFSGLAPRDGIDNITISDAASGGTDLSTKFHMQVSAQIKQNTNTQKYTAVGSVTHRGTDASLQNLAPSDTVSIELGSPVVSP